MPVFVNFQSNQPNQVEDVTYEEVTTLSKDSINDNTISNNNSSSINSSDGSTDTGIDTEYKEYICKTTITKHIVSNKDLTNPAYNSRELSLFDELSAIFKELERAGIKIKHNPLSDWSIDKIEFYDSVNQDSKSE